MKRTEESSSGEARFPRLLKVPEAARYLSFPRKQIYLLIWGREVPAIRRGKSYYIDVRDLDAFVDRAKRVA